jgi:hypothetical protein
MDLVRRVREARTEKERLWHANRWHFAELWEFKEKSLLEQLGKIYERKLTEGPASNAKGDSQSHGK